MHALIICDDEDETALLSFVLQRVGVTQTSATDLERALQRWSERPADLVLLATRPRVLDEDIRSVRRITEAPITLVTEPLSEDRYCAYYDAGVDVLVVRPFSARLLAAQLRALMRRAKGSTLLALPLLAVGDLTLDPSTRTVTVAGRQRRRLTPLEFRLLYTLILYRGQTLPTALLVERVWGYEGDGSTDLVRGLVRRLRTKIELDPRLPKHVLTVPGVGYRLNIGAE
ncbi:MAG: response regulator transcription factor [Chloroflexi bacterium]|jgi:DNA-binding response OmpR family regulator|nr:response regulator transcription factor [Chloroflexota bacterium]